MTRDLSTLLREARGLVGNGRLDEATARIIGTLSGAAGTPTPFGKMTLGGFQGPTIDLEALPAGVSARLAGSGPNGAAKAGGRLDATRMPDGARFLTLHHAGASGSRAYRLYVPASRPPGPLPLVVMLHGCTQNADDFAAGTRMNEAAEAEGLLVAYPEQSSSANAQRCWNWFEPTHQQAGSGEPAIIAGIVGDIAKAYEVDRTKTFAAGLSAGGAMAAILAVTYPDLFAAVGVHSGLPYRSARDVVSALSAMRNGSPGPLAPRTASRMIVFHGESDRTVHPGNGESLARLPGVEGARPSVKSGSANGRRYRRSRLVDAKGVARIEHWSVEGLGHAWSGGDGRGSYADPLGPDATREMLRFFFDRR